MLNEKNYWFFLIVLSIIFGVIYSLHWIVPFLSHEFYIPINKFYISTGYDDNYIWYSHIKDILNGRIILRDPTNIEFQNIYSIFITYNFSILFASIAGIFTEKISNIYNFNYFFFPALNFIVISLLIKNFVKTNSINFLITTLVVYLTQPTNIFYLLKDILTNFTNLWEVLITSEFTSIHANRSNQLHRIPNIMITNIFLILNLYFILNYKINFKKFIFSIMFILSVGSSIYCSANNFLISFTFLFFTILYEYKNKEYFKYLLSIFFLSTLLSVPGIIILIKNFFSIDFFEFISVANKETTVNKYDKSKNITFNNFIFLYKYIFYLAVIIIATYKIKILKNKKYFLIAPIPIYMLLSVLTLLIIGKPFEWRILNRGILFLISISFYTSLVFLIFHYIKIQKKLVCWTIIILLNIMFFSNQFTYAKKNSHKYNQKNLYLLFGWINENTFKDEYFITIDGKLMPNLIIYTNANLYISLQELSFRDLDERLKRLSEVFAKLKLSEEDLYNFLLNKNSELYSKEMHINVFYEKKLDNEKRKHFREILIQNFKRINKNKKKFNNRADYLIINTTSNLKILINILKKNNSINYKDVYRNEEYTVLKIIH